MFLVLKIDQILNGTRKYKQSPRQRRRLFLYFVPSSWSNFQDGYIVKCPTLVSLTKN